MRMHNQVNARAGIFDALTCLHFFFISGTECWQWNIQQHYFNILKNKYKMITADIRFRTVETLKVYTALRKDQDSYFNSSPRLVFMNLFI